MDSARSGTYEVLHDIRLKYVTSGVVARAPWLVFLDKKVIEKRCFQSIVVKSVDFRAKNISRCRTTKNVWLSSRRGPNHLQVDLRRSKRHFGSPLN